MVEPYDADLNMNVSIPEEYVNWISDRFNYIEKNIIYKLKSKYNFSYDKTQYQIRIDKHLKIVVCLDYNGTNDFKISFLLKYDKYDINVYIEKISEIEDILIKYLENHELTINILHPN